MISFIHLNNAGIEGNENPNNDSRKQIKKYPTNILTSITNGLPIIFNIIHTISIIAKFMGTDITNANKFANKFEIIV